MKTTSIHFLWVSLILVTLAMLCPQQVCATGATSSEINNAIVQDGSIPLTWENDATHPWIIDNGRLKSGNAGVKNSNSKIKLKYSSSCITNISFNYQNNDYNTSSHRVEIAIDGVVRFDSNSSTSVKDVQFRLPIGNHSIEIRDSIGNYTSDRYYATLWNLKITESQPATSESLNNSIVCEGSSNIEWVNDTVYPWIIENGIAKSGNFGLRNTSSRLSFSYNAPTTSQLSFKYQNNNYSSSIHFVSVYIDGELSYESNSSQSVKEVDLYLPRGKHNVCLIDSLGNSDSYDYYMKVWDVKAYAFDNLDSSILTSRSLPLSFSDNGLQPWYIEDGCAKSSNYRVANSNSVLQSEVLVEKPTILSFSTKSGYPNSDHKFRFLINKDCYYESSYSSDWNFISVVLQPGQYLLEWRDENKYSGNEYYSLIKDVELYDECVDVSITPGMLGVEVLYKVNVLTDIEMLRIKGTLNESDWATVKMMTNLKSLDLTDAVVDHIVDNQFKSLKYLNTIVLPDGVKTIGKAAFVGTNIYYLTIPASVESIGQEAFANTRLAKIDFAPDSKLATIGYQAFYRCKELKEFIMPNSVTSLETYSSGYAESSTFSECSSLRKISFSDALTYLPAYTCNNNSAVEEMHLPGNLITIGDNFMYAANSLKELNLPKTVRNIGRSAFAGLHQVEHLVLPERLSTIGNGAFHNSSRLKIVEIPSGIGTLEATFRGCEKIDKIICHAATPPAVSIDAFSSVTKENVTLEVPSFAVANYKLDSYWYQFGNIVEGQPVDYWKIIGDLKLLNNRRMEGKPDIDLYYNGKLTVGGDAPMTVGKLDIYTSDENPSSLVTDCKNITTDEINIIYHVDANKWYFITPMVDVDLRQVNVTGTPNYVFRYYDGATRADIGAGTSWKNVSDMTLRSGVGYIFQCNAASDVMFPVPVNMHSEVLTTESVTLPLTAHPSDNAANKGWNYVGNPFPSYYDIYYMDFTAPITVWTGSTYRAYSISDDNYVLRPMQGFFVQKPDAVDVITLQPAGRQIESSVNRIQKNAVCSRYNAREDRFIFNLEINEDADSMADVTRIVLNQAASMDYEINRDASKFMSMDETVPQIYSIDNDNNRLAINERPSGMGIISLGVYIPSSDKTYSIKASRMDGEALLYDALTGTTHDLSTGNYSFTAENGLSDNRFSIRLQSNISSGVENIMNANNIKVKTVPGGVVIENADECLALVYALDGTAVYDSVLTDDHKYISLGKGLYVIVVNGTSYKVIVK